MSERREFLLLADTFNADKHDPIGMIASEKLDGNRCFWDGGVSRGDDTINVPWASVLNPKTGGPKDKVKPKATGLWSRYGNPIQAPDWFLDRLPPEPLDGELYAGRGNFQLTQTIVRRDDPNEGAWEKIKFLAFAAPGFGSVFQTGLIKNANFLCKIDVAECRDYIQSLGFGFQTEPSTYAEELDMLDDLAAYYGGNSFGVVGTVVIESMNQLETMTRKVVELGGEGVMLRDPESIWYPKRRPFLLKVKPRYDAEATIVGFYSGKKGKTSQFHGKLGGLICQWQGSEDAPCGVLSEPQEFEIGTGLTHADREVFDLDVPYLKKHPGCTVGIDGTPIFRKGMRVTFSYMGVTNDLKPREPAYLRIREDI